MDFNNEINTDNFNSISLIETEKLNLGNRKDFKFIFHISKLNNILNSLDKIYSILEIDNNNIFRYKTLYFDTDNFDLYKAHHNGKLNRFKIRYREYTETNKSFFEIKFKTNKKDTIKKRLLVPKLTEKLSNLEINFLRNNNFTISNKINAKLYNCFNRISLYNNNFSEKVTFDFNHTYNNFDKKIHLKNLCIAEVKQSSLNLNSEIYQILKNNNIYKTSFSKYCIGISLLNKNLKHNNFKNKQLIINKFEVWFYLKF